LKTRDRIIALHKLGLSNVEITRIVGVSRQRVWAVLNSKERNRKHDTSAAGLSAPKKTQITPLSSTMIAAFLGVHPNTIRRWSDNGVLPCFRLGPRKDRRFEVQRIMEMIRKGI
jgi:IS30 family transposase